MPKVVETITSKRVILRARLSGMMGVHVMLLIVETQDVRAIMGTCLALEANTWLVGPQFSTRLQVLQPA